MPELTNYLDLRTIQQLQDAFTTVAKAPIRICDASMQPLAPQSAVAAPDHSAVSQVARAEAVHFQQAPENLEEISAVPVVVEDDVVGYIRLEGQLSADAVTPPQKTEAFHHALTLLRLAVNLVTQLCRREAMLQSRVNELATLYKLTAEFTGQRDLQTVLDLVARTVVSVLKVKACAIRLLSEDGKELLLKAAANLSKEYLAKGAILVSESQIDAVVLSSMMPVYISDEQDDPRVRFPEQARSEGIVSALCAPLAYKGRCEGVLRVYTSEPHEFDSFEVNLVQAIAAEAAAAIVSARLYEEAVNSANMRRALHMAGEVQRRMIPTRLPSVPGVEIGAIYVPTFELSGDFYDFIDLPPDNVGVAVCDVAGKGVRASLLMAALRAYLRAHAANIYDMSTVLSRVNQNLCADILSSDFATLFYGVLDYRTRRFTYSNAGHLPPILFRGGRSCYLDTGGTILGLDPQSRYKFDSFQLQAGDVILAYTDGLPDALNFADEPFGRRRAESAAAAAIGQNQSAEGIARHVLWEMRRFSGLQTRLDDLTIVAIRVL